MSGIDEQIPDVPVCPICEGRPSFWILYPTRTRTGKHGWYWLHSDEYLKNDTTSDRLVSMSVPNGRYTTLDEIVIVVCQQKRNKWHSFTSETSTFQEVLQQARRLER